MLIYLFIYFYFLYFTSLRPMPHKSSDKYDSVANVVEDMLDEFETTNSGSSEVSEETNLQDHLESAHQTAMVVGAFTVLAQILLVKPNLKLKSYCLTRTEIVNLLCVSDPFWTTVPSFCSLLWTPCP